MLLRDMDTRDIFLGSLAHRDGGAFEVSAKLYLTPPAYNYWLAVFDAHHEAWGHMRFQAVIPKGIAESLDHANLLITGALWDQVASSLRAADASGRALAPVFSADGWTLV
jgi:hypothetical protein